MKNIIKKNTADFGNEPYLWILAAAMLGVFAVTAVAGEIVSVRRGGNNYFAHGDGFRNTSVLTDSNGVVSESYEYNYFGNASFFGSEGQAITEPTNPILFQGGYFDKETRLLWTSRGYYEPNTGDFTNQTITQAGGAIGNFTILPDEPSAGGTMEPSITPEELFAMAVSDYQVPTCIPMDAGCRLDAWYVLGTASVKVTGGGICGLTDQGSPASGSYDFAQSGNTSAGINVYGFFDVFTELFLAGFGNNQVLSLVGVDPTRSLRDGFSDETPRSAAGMRVAIHRYESGPDVLPGQVGMSAAPLPRLSTNAGTNSFDGAYRPISKYRPSVRHLPGFEVEDNLYYDPTPVSSIGDPVVPIVNQDNILFGLPGERADLYDMDIGTPPGLRSDCQPPAIAWGGAAMPAGLIGNGGPGQGTGLIGNGGAGRRFGYARPYPDRVVDNGDCTADIVALTGEVLDGL